MSAFEYASPNSVEEAVAILASRSEARPLAGGQKMLLERNSDISGKTVLVDLGRISSLKGIERQGEALRIGAMTTLNEIAVSSLVGKELPAFAEAVGSIGDAQLRNRATIGGNLAEGDPEYDLPALLLALDASIESVGSQARRSIRAADYFKGQNRSSRTGNELITSVTIPIPAAKSGMAYVRIKHPARLTAICAVAAIVSTERGRIAAARVALGGATDHPTRLEAVEKALLNGPVNGEKGPSESAISVDGIDFRGDMFASAEYRRHLARVLTGRAIKQALLRATA